MTHTPEPAAEGESTTTAPSAQTEPSTARRRRSLWTGLNRTNRIAALVLGAVAAVFIAALIFAAGLFVGAEFGSEEGHHDGGDTSEYADDNHASGEHEGDGGESAGDGDQEGSEGADSESGQGQRDEQGQSDGPEGRAPSESNGPPRP